MHHEEKEVLLVKEGGGFGLFLKGALVGAALGLLFAPRSGREIRDLLSERGGEFYDKASYIARDTRDRAQSLVKEARHKIDEVKHQAQSEVDSETNKDLKRELEITEDINNPHFPL